MVNKEKLSRQRCTNHAEREAVARCPECKRHFCRECITEHNDKQLCNHCLNKISTDNAKKSNRIKAVVYMICCVVGFLIALGFFYTAAKVISSVPQQYHRNYLGF
jgi:uncharacterized paraquat-inducible protein A